MVSPFSKKVFIEPYGPKLVYEDCDAAPLATNSISNLAANEIIILTDGNNSFQIQSQQDMKGLVLMNINGVELRTDRGKSNMTNVDYSAYPSGLYLLKIISNNQVITKKLRIE